MANVKFSGLPVASTVLPSDIFCITQGGTSKQSSLSNLWEATAVGNANYTMLATDVLVYTSVAFTAPRTWTLPSAASYGPGRILRICDAIGTTSGTNPLTIAAAGGDVVAGGGSISLTTAGQGVLLVSNGVSIWTLLSITFLPTSLLICEGSTGSAPPAKLGEYISSGAVTGVSLVSGTAKSITSISLTPGDWDVSGAGGIVGTAGATYTAIYAGSSLTNNTLSVDLAGFTSGAITLGANGAYVAIPTVCFSLGAPTTLVYFVLVSTFTGTVTGSGKINARRMR